MSLFIVLYIARPNDASYLLAKLTRTPLTCRCSQCKEVFLDLLSKQNLSVAQKHIRSPVQLADRRTSGGPLSPRWSGTLNPKSPQLSEKTFHSIALSAPAEERHFDNTYKYSHSRATKDPLSVAHPRPCPIETGRSTDRSNQDKLTRKMRESDMDLEEVGSPDALYFAKRSRRSYAYTNRSRRQVEPCVTSLKTSSRIQKVEDEDMSP